VATTEKYFAGLAIGADCGDIEAALVSIHSRGERMKLKVITGLNTPIKPKITAALRRVVWEETPSKPPDKLTSQLAEVYISAANAVITASRINRKDILAAGFLGPIGGSGELQLLPASDIAKSLELPVVAGFGPSDMVAGGMGENVTAWANWVLFRDKRLSRVLVHLGSLSSITFIGSAAGACEVLARNTGPGTFLIDEICSEQLSKPCDTDRANASRGTVHPELLGELLGNSRRLLGQAAYPRPTEPAKWAGKYLHTLGRSAKMMKCKGKDLVATLTEMSAQNIARNISRLTERPHQVILTGGGSKNIHLAGRIRSLLSPSSTLAIEKFDIPARSHQAVCTALLAKARCDSVSIYCPEATGAKVPAIIGTLLPG